MLKAWGSVYRQGAARVLRAYDAPAIFLFVTPNFSSSRRKPGSNSPPSRRRHDGPRLSPGRRNEELGAASGEIVTRRRDSRGEGLLLRLSASRRLRARVTSIDS